LTHNGIAEPIPIGTVRRPFHRSGMGWAWDVAEHSVELRVDYISSRADEMHGEIRVTRNTKHLHLARFNLSSTTSRGTLVRALEVQTKGLDIPWPRLVEQFCVGVLQHEREGEPTRFTGSAPERRLQYLIDKLLIRGKTNMLFAPGGAGKGYLSVGMCCALACHHGLANLSVMAASPFYFDWEDDFETFEDRLNAVARGLGVEVPRLPYRRMRGLAPDHINEMARAMADAGSDFGVIDSFSAAGGTTSERTSWDTVAHRMFDALDQVPNVTWLLVDHVVGDKVNDPAGKAFGSIQKMNRVRNAWEMRSEQEPGSKTVHMRLFDAKWNHTGKRPPMGIRMAFTADGVTFSSEDPLEQPSVSTATRMGMQLASGPLDTSGLARALSCSESTIRGELRRNQYRFRRDAETGLIHLVQQDQPAASDTREPLPW
jgi:hypothetical protein